MIKFMGQLKIIETGSIFPSQDYLKPSTLEFILACIKNADFESLPPAPIVRPNPDSDGYIAIDGHNLIAVYDFMRKSVEVYVAESATDALAPTTAAITLRNQNLSKKFESSLQQARKLQKRDLTSFKQLRNKYPEILDE